ncbi:MAG: MarR family transcriptional regulator [Microbacteriaceae bacterium]|jgi:DNA-binding MarR family transcriptional regulator|nr:MarR family transcriptional regulator [Microbacteriaceae bacterium]
MPHDDQELRLAIQRVARRIRSMQADEDVTEGQRSVLFALSNRGPQTLGSLSEHERVTPPSMNRTINALVAAGLVTRTIADDDARKVKLDLSDAGHDFIKETKRRRDAWFTKRLAALTPEQRRVLDEVTPILREIADQ